MGKVLKGVVYTASTLVGILFVAYLQQATLFRWFLELPDYETEKQGVVTEYVAMSDGVKLSTDIYFPTGNGPWPAVLLRDPYSMHAWKCELLVRYGYVCIHQDVRGRYGSEGEWYPVVNERKDGLETLDWLIEQDWQNGKIATTGGSYLGMVQWAMIDEMPDEVKTVTVGISHGDWYKIVNRGGHFIQGVMTSWALDMHESEYSLEEMAAYKPMSKANGEFLGKERRWYRDYISHMDKSGDYWQSPTYQTIRNAHKQAKMPVLMTGQWHDFFVEDQFNVFEELPAREDSMLAIGNGSHVPYMYGIDSMIDWARFGQALNLAWLDFHLKGKTNEQLVRPGYLLMNNVTGEYEFYKNRPVPSKSIELLLGNLNRAVECDGGHLYKSPESKASKASYIYNPAHPVPSKGGSYHFGAGVVEQGNENCARDDVLSFESDKYENGFVITGITKITLNVSSDAEDSAFTVKLQEKLVDGRVLNIRDDITSLSYRNKSGVRLDYTPGEVVELIYTLPEINWTVSPGSSIRLDVSSSNFPIYNAHPNTADLWSDVVESKKANQTVYSGTVSLPVR